MSGVATAILADLFTSSRLREVAWHGVTETLEHAVAALQSRRKFLKGFTVGDVLETAFRVLTREYPIEYVYKNCVSQRLLFGTYSPNTAALYVEFPVLEARADLLLVNGNATVYEIKTRFDDEYRLEGQLDQYYRAFTRVVVVVDPDEGERYVRMLPTHVGVSVLTRRFSLSVLRAPLDCRASLASEHIFGLLRQNEYRQVVGALGPIDPADEYQASLARFRCLDPVKAHSLLIGKLRARQRTTGIAALSASLPNSLQVAPFAYRWRKSDWQQLIQRMEQAIG